MAYTALLLAEPSQAWWSTPSDGLRKYRNDFYAIPANRAKKNARQRAYYYRHRERALAAMRALNYGCTNDELDAMFATQQGKCAICQMPEVTTHKGRPRQLSVDHDHVTGKIRALLCVACNTGLGFLRDDPAVLEAAIAYLDAHAADR